MEIGQNCLLYSKMLDSNFKVFRSNEANFANEYKMDNGNLYFNHRGCEAPVEALIIERGTGDHSLTTIKVRDVFIGDTSVKTKLGI